MTSAELPGELRKTHADLWQACTTMNAKQVSTSTDGKWSAVQHLQHVHKGVAAITDYLKLDRHKIEVTFGIASHASRTYDAVLLLYTNRLREGAVSTPRFNPAESKDIDLPSEVETGKRLVKEMIASLDLWSDAWLDRYACPHPNLGMLTAREMLFFIVIHAIHHTRAIHSLKKSFAHGTFLF
jgi:uncharacterized damage-inducible protein DinB